VKQLRKLFAQPKLALAVFVFIGGVILGIMYREWLSETVLVAVLYVFWAADLALKGFDQRTIWLLALLMALVLSARYSQRKAEPRGIRRTTLLKDAPPRGRLHFWQKQVKLLSGIDNAPSYMYQDLSQLILKTLADREKSSKAEINERIRLGKIVVPNEVRYALGLESVQDFSTQQAAKIPWFQKISGWMKKRFFAPPFKPDPRLERVADYLESILESENE
jgi:hypothetical protein